MAFQKKKGKRRKKKGDTSTGGGPHSHSGEDSLSLGALDVTADSSEATLSHSGNVSPSIFDEAGGPLDGGGGVGENLTNSLPVVSCCVVMCGEVTVKSYWGV